MDSTLALTVDKLEVPGASLYYEVRGSGPVLLMMPGGPADAATFRRIENDLGARCTVITYDPRGLSHSELTQPFDDARMVELFADDVHHLLNHLAGGRKANIFASSGGAVIALEVIKEHADQIASVVLHEPPSPAFLSDPSGVRREMEAVCDTYAAAGLWPALETFMALAGIEGGPPPAPEGEPAPEALEAMAMMQSNMHLFFGRYVRNIARYQPDLAALKSADCRIVPAVAADSAGQLAHDGGLGLARLLGTEAVVFPGDHSGFDGKPDEFAAKLLEVLG